MQMISRNRNGVTLIALIVTIIVLLIILSITINYGVSEIRSVSNKKFESELAIVQEAVMQRFALVKASNELGVIATSISSEVKIENDSNRPKKLVGTRLPSSASITNKGFSNINYLQEYSSGESNLEYEKYYYLLDENDLKDLGIEKGDDGRSADESNSKSRSYIVNYFTGEIFDVVKKTYFNTDSRQNEQVYLQPTPVNMVFDTYVFNDENTTN